MIPFEDMPTVAQTIKMLEATLAQLKKANPKLKVGQVLMPDGGYSGDMEPGFTKLDASVEPTSEDGKEKMVVLYCHW